MNSGRRVSFLILMSLFLTSVMPAIVAADGSVNPPTIRADWVDESDAGKSDHAWVFKFDSEPDAAALADLQARILHQDDSGAEILNLTVNMSSLNVSIDNGSASYRWAPTSNLSFGDQILVEALDDGAVVSSRGVSVTTWNQPLADHVVTISTNWEIDQQYTDENGSQSYSLIFVGQGWQQRIGDTLIANELGAGSLDIFESTSDGTMELEVTLLTIWRNETTISGILERQEFEATGIGELNISNSDGGETTSINASVTDALFNRTYANGSHSEHIRLQALGDMSITDEGDEDNGTWIDGDLSLLLVETIDVDGERTFSLLHIEALADMQVIDGDSYMDIELDQLINIERWEDGERTQQQSLLKGHGNFGFTDEEENGSVVINGTIIDFHMASQDGETTQERIHVDGTIEGDADGEFGLLRELQETGTWQNHNGTQFEVNVIQDQNWFNITGAGPWTGGSGGGAGTHHNESWYYDAKSIDWDNRTIYHRWQSSGFIENSEGEEYPNGSPIQQAPEAPEAEEGLGEANISRETGLVPAPLRPEDEVVLDGQDGLILHVTATQTDTVIKDGHSLPVTRWTGTYVGTETGTASGALVNTGILNGLIAEVLRSAELESPSGEPVVFNETQDLERVLSPTIVTASENVGPTIVESGIVEGLLVNENGSAGHLYVEIDDPDWNTVSVIADLSPMGLGSLALNDVGVEGDMEIADDIWTGELSYPGILQGVIQVNITATDIWGASDNATANISIHNQAPRLTFFDFTPFQVVRGDSIVVNAEAHDGNNVSSVAIDFREHGGELVQLTYNAPVNKWSGMVDIPFGISPGEHQLKVMMVDELGASITVVDKQTLGIHGLPHEDDEIRPLVVMNDGPVFLSVSIDENPVKRPTSGKGSQVITAHVNDFDGISNVVINLGDLSPAGQQGQWILMRDDGLGGDPVAGDGNWTYVVETRAGMPLGTTALLLRATDVYGAWAEDDSLAVEVIIENSGTGGGDPISVFSNEYIVYGLLGIMFLVAIGVVTMLIRKGGGGGGLKWDDGDAFGGA